LYTPEISQISNELRALGESDVMSRQILRRQLRRAQRRRVYQVEGDTSRILYEDRSRFWREVKKAKKCSARRATILNSKPSAEAFMSFYRTLFSHHDRPSNETHQAVSASVKEYAESLRNRMLAFNLSKAAVCDALYVLKPGKAAGANGISNEFLIYGTSEILVEALHILSDL